MKRTLTIIAIIAGIVVVLAISALASPTRADTLTSFHTPSKNIYCLASESEDANFMDCEILVMTK